MSTTPSAASEPNLTTAMSSFNPFRTPALTPNPTGSSSTASKNTQTLSENPFHAGSSPSLSQHTPSSPPSFPAPQTAQPSPFDAWSDSSSDSGHSASGRAEQLPGIDTVRSPANVHGPQSSFRSMPTEPAVTNTGSQSLNVPPLPPRSSTGSSTTSTAGAGPPLPPRSSSPGVRQFAPPPGPPPGRSPIASAAHSRDNSTSSLRSQGAAQGSSPRRDFAPPPGPPPTARNMPSPNANPAGRSQVGSQPARVDSLGPPPGSPPRITTSLDDGELPPAYTSTADVRHGEETIDIGPRRPFQRAPAQPVSSATSSPRRLSPARTPVEPSRASNAASPSPRQPQAVTSSTAAARQRPLSDFARDFYAAGAGDVTSSGASEQARPRYQPPPGPPPPTRSRPLSDSGTSLQSSISPPSVPPNSAPLQRSVTGASSSSSSRAAAAATPTTTPTPGRPLLNAGHTLMYPEGYVCMKCQNTGYKNFDPSHPCRRCWRNYSKLFTQLLALAPWGSSQSRMQRPLPNFAAPRAT